MSALERSFTLAQVSHKLLTRLLGQDVPKHDGAPAGLAGQVGEEGGREARHVLSVEFEGGESEGKAGQPGEEVPTEELAKMSITYAREMEQIV